MSSYRIGKNLNVTTTDLIGLMFLPIIFYPLVSRKDYKYKIEDEEYTEALENVKTDSVLLLSQEELEALNKQKEETNNTSVDSIFKSDIQTMEEVAPYKATSISPKVNNNDDNNNTEIIDL